MNAEEPACSAHRASNAAFDAYDDLYSPGWREAKPHEGGARYGGDMSVQAMVDFTDRATGVGERVLLTFASIPRVGEMIYTDDDATLPGNRWKVTEVGHPVYRNGLEVAPYVMTERLS